MRRFILGAPSTAFKRLPKVVLFLFAIAAGSRTAIAYLQVESGIHGTYWFFFTQWRDFYELYGSYIISLNHGLLPYLNFGYWYTPLFLYVLYAFYLLGGIHLASAPILIADAATAPLAYLIASTISVKKVAFVAGLLYALSPVALFVEGYLWLSSQPMTFFLLLSIYWLRRDRPLFSVVALAVSILFKQEAVFILPAYGVWYVMKYRTKVWKGVVILTGLLFLVSLPFLIISPVGYLNGVTTGSLGVVYDGASVASSTLSSSSLVTNASQFCVSTLPKTFTGSFVNCGLTYSLKSPSFSYVVFNILEWIASLAVFPIFVMATVLLFLSRNRNNILELSCALSIVGCLLLFSLYVHSLMVYYFIPVYAFLFASARGKSSLAVLAILSVLSAFTPDKSYVAALLALIALSTILACDTEWSVTSMNLTKRTDFNFAKFLTALKSKVALKKIHLERHMMTLRYLSKFQGRKCAKARYKIVTSRRYHSTLSSQD